MGIYISPVKGWNCHGIADQFGQPEAICYATPPSGWLEDDDVNRCLAETPKVDSCAHVSNVSIFSKLLQDWRWFWAMAFGGQDMTRWVLTALSHVMGRGWNSGCKELADRDAPKPKVQVCCEPQQMPEGQKARFEPTFCTCVPCN